MSNKVRRYILWSFALLGMAASGALIGAIAVGIAEYVGGLNRSSLQLVWLAAFSAAILLFQLLLWPLAGASKANLERPRTRRWVTCEFYREIPEDHRRGFVVGALDMLFYSFHYAAPQHRARLDAMIDYAAKSNIEDLTEKFDGHISTCEESMSDGAARQLFIALNKWSGFELKK